ncbi:MAG: hypothetical protein L0229_28425 [Blastocatellia bacterium]|nr:hypothetical protein [Blastocatellia bacterium]
MIDERANDIGTLEAIEIRLSELTDISSITVQVRRCGDRAIVMGHPILKAESEGGNITGQYLLDDILSYA